MTANQVSGQHQLQHSVLMTSGLRRRSSTLTEHEACTETDASTAWRSCPENPTPHCE
jgi:hypothetical protein